MTTGNRLGDLFEASANVSDGSLPFGLADLLVGRAEYEEHAAGHDIAAVGVGDLMA